MKILVTSIVTIVLAIGFMLLVQHGLDLNDRAECLRMEQYSKEYELFYVTEWQKVMCDSFGFTFAGTQEAPVLIRNGMQLQSGVWYFDGNTKVRMN